MYAYMSAGANEQKYARTRTRARHFIVIIFFLFSKIQRITFFFYTT